MKKYLFLLLAGLLWANLAGAQTSADPFSDVLRRMNDLMLRGMPSGDSTGLGGAFYSFPADSSFFFQFDTTFSDGSGSFFFHFSPG